MADTLLDRIRSLIDDGKTFAEVREILDPELTDEQRAAFDDLESMGLVVGLRSDVWEQPDGKYRWELRYPPAGLSTRGRANTVAGAYVRMDDVAREWFDAADDYAGITVLRALFDSDTGPVEN